MPIGDGSIARAIGKGLKERFPIGGAILETLGPEVIQAIQGPNQIVDIGALAEKLEKVAKKEPEVVNNLNLESPIQSGTTLAMGGALLTSGGVVIAMVRSGDIDVGMLSTQLAIIIASILGLWRRWGSGLKPLFSRGK